MGDRLGIRGAVDFLVADATLAIPAIRQSVTHSVPKDFVTSFSFCILSETIRH